MNTIAEKIKKLKFNKAQTQAIAHYQAGGMINGYATNQKEISRVLKNVQTNEVKDGNLQPGYYTRVDYKDGTQDYVTSSNEDYLMRMPNYINYMRRNNPPQINNTSSVAMNSYQQGGYAQELNRPYRGNSVGFAEGFGMNPNMDYGMPNRYPKPSNNYPYETPDFTGLYENQQYGAKENNAITENYTSQPNTPLYSDYIQGDANSDGVVDENDKTDKYGNPINSAKKEYKNTALKYRNFGNLSNIINYTGDQFGQGNTGMGILGAGLSVLGGAREFMGGLARGRENARISKEYTDNLYKDSRQYLPAQQGGKVTNAEMLTGQYIADEGQGNINMERDEVVRRANSGNVQKVVGEPHIKNGKKAEGVNATLNEGDKVLSNYTKIPKEEIKEIEKKFNIKLKKDATFADAQKAFDKKLGIEDLTEELAQAIEKVGENENTKDATTKKLNELVLTKQIESTKDKLDILNGAQSMIFEELFAIQETVPRLGDGSQLFDKKGKVVDEEDGEMAQQGGYIELAKKYGITPQRARELMTMQQGGEQGQEMPQQQDQMQQIFQAIAQMMQQQMPPQEIAQKLVEMGIPQEQVGQLIQQVAEQLNQQEQAPQEQQPMPQEQQMAQQGMRYAQEAPYEFLGDGTASQADLTGIEAVQSFTGKGYGNKTEDVDKFIDTHKWYFDSEDKKNKFKQDVVKKGGGEAVKSFQESYDTEIRSRAEKAGMSKDEVDSAVNKLGFSGKGFQKADGLFGTFTSTRRIGDFKKTTTPTKTDVATTTTNSIIPEKNYDIYTGEDAQSTNTDVEQEYNGYFSTPQRMWMPPPAMRSIKKEQISLGRQDYNPIDLNLSEQERIRQTEIEKIMQSGLTEQQKASMVSSALASSQIAANDATGKVSQFNNQLMNSTNNYNLGQRDKENLTNTQYRQDYLNKTEASRVNDFKDWSNFYNDIHKDNMANFDRALIQDLGSTDNYDISDDGVAYKRSWQAINMGMPKLDGYIAELTPEQTKKYSEYVRKGLNKGSAYNKAIQV